MNVYTFVLKEVTYHSIAGWKCASAREFEA